MPEFSYRGSTPTESDVEGRIEAQTLDEAVALLKAREVKVSEICETVPCPPQEPVRHCPSPADRGAVTAFFRQYAAMTQTGLPLERALEILAPQVQNRSFRSAIKTVLHDVQSGNTLANSFRRHPRFFNAFISTMVDAGEEGGILDVAIGRVAAYCERTDELHRQIRSAIVYPVEALLMTLGALALVNLLASPLSRDSVGSPSTLHLSAGPLVHGLAGVPVGGWITLLGAIAVAMLVRRAYVRSDTGRRAGDRVLFSMPVIGGLARKWAVARFARALNAMLTVGVPFTTALELSAWEAGNADVARATLEAKSEIEKGAVFADALEKSGVFPLMTVQLISIGEATGALDWVMDNIANIYEAEVELAVNTATAKAMPVMMVLFAVTGGGLFLSLLSLVSP